MSQYLHVTLDHVKTYVILRALTREIEYLDLEYEDKTDMHEKDRAYYGHLILTRDFLRNCIAIQDLAKRANTIIPA